MLQHTVNKVARQQDPLPLPYLLTQVSLHKVTDTHVVDTPAHLNHPLTQPAPLSTFTLGYPQTPPSPWRTPRPTHPAPSPTLRPTTS